MQYYHLNTRVKRTATTKRILMFVNVVLFLGLIYILALPFIQ